MQPYSGGGSRTGWVAPLAVALLTFAAFLPVLHAGFVTWDDDRNFLDNPNYRGLGFKQLGWMWTTFHMGHYIPLSWMTLGLDYSLWGMNAAGYHLVNLLLHTANAVVLYFIARRLLRSTGVFGPTPDFRTLAIPAGFAALLFAVHPLRVESVAWITERRDVLSGLFYLLSVLFYLKASEERADRRRWYWSSLAVFSCALLSKGSAVTLPAVLLILSVYPLRRLGGERGWLSESARRIYAEVAPFALLAATTSALSMVALHPPKQLNVAGKLAVSSYSLAFYLWKTIAPVSLSPLWEMPKNLNPAAAIFVVSYVAVIGLVGLAWAARRRWPGVTAALVLFVVILLPLLGVVQNGPQIVADRYTYNAAPALAILAGAGFSLFRRPFALAPAGIGAAVLLALGALTWNQSRVWRDSESLWTHVLSLDSNSSIAHIALGNLLLKQNRTPEALAHYYRGLEIDPEYAEAYNDIGVALSRQGKFDEAIEQYQLALKFKPRYANPHNNWGVAIAERGSPALAIPHYLLALSIDSRYPDAHINWGNALQRMGKVSEAIVHYRDALELRPDDADAQLNWGVALAQLGRLAEAIEHFRQALAIKPDHAEAQKYLRQAMRLQQRANDRSR